MRLVKPKDETFLLEEILTVYFRAFSFLLPFASISQSSNLYNNMLHSAIKIGPDIFEKIACLANWRQFYQFIIFLHLLHRIRRKLFAPLAPLPPPPRPFTQPAHCCVFFLSTFFFVLGSSYSCRLPRVDNTRLLQFARTLHSRYRLRPTKEFFRVQINTVRWYYFRVKLLVGPERS